MQSSGKVKMVSFGNLFLDVFFLFPQINSLREDSLSSVPYREIGECIITQ